VDSTVAIALRHIEAPKETHAAVINSMTLAAGVSLADLDLSTLEGAGVARQRLEAVARRLCDELALQPAGHETRLRT
jgi:UrcA family protein